MKALFVVQPVLFSVLSSVSLFAPAWLPTAALPPTVASCSYTAGWGFWLPANLVNFVFVPPTGRVLFANAAGAVEAGGLELGWVCWRG